MELGSHWRVKLHLETTAEVGRHSTPIERLIFGSDYGWKPPLRTYGKTIMTLEMYLRFEKALESHCSSVTALSNLWESQNYLEITIGRVKRHWEAIEGVKRLESNHGSEMAYRQQLSEVTTAFEISGRSYMSI